MKVFDIEKTSHYIKFKKDVKFNKSKIFKKQNIRIGEGTHICKDVIIRSNVVINGDVLICDRAQIGNFTLIRENCCIGRDVKIGACNALELGVTIGQRTRTQGHCMIGEYTDIGIDCFLGPHWNSMGDNEIGAPKETYKANPPKIGNRCRFGSATKVGPGVNVASGTITGAMTFLNKDTEKDTLYYGIPFKKIRKIEKDIINEGEK